MKYQTEQIPKWQQEFMSFRGIKSTFIIEGNIHDIYPVYDLEGGTYRINSFKPLDKMLGNLFALGVTNGKYEFLYCNPVMGFYDPLYSNYTGEIVHEFENRTAEQKREWGLLNGKEKQEGYNNIRMIQNSEIIRTAMTLRDCRENSEEVKAKAIILDMASRFLVSSELSTDENTFYTNLLYASNCAIRGNEFMNTLILIVEKMNDIPPWFYINNPNIRIISVPNPDRTVRGKYIRKNYKIFQGDLDAKMEKLYERFTDLTEGMKLLEIRELWFLYERHKEEVEDILEIVSIYKYGFKEDKWKQIRKKVTNDMKGEIEKRVKGQEQAVDKIVRIIKRAVAGLSGMQHLSGNKPRGILFLAGPTGTGKTEVVKAVTKLLFEDERALIRFDMSEYTQEQSDQKLFGAPPGYAGYDSGGQLTNAVRNNPFSVILFDEIEKAHPSIMDKFLQILEDGRMTDGQGRTVYFSETLIFFTSNAGISREVIESFTGRVTGRECMVLPGTPYEVIQDKIEEALRVYFKPEVLNRIGDNIIVFDYINAQAAKEIIESQIESINDNLRKTQRLEIKVCSDVYELLERKCQEEKVKLNGGRGIGNVIESLYLNPLAEFLFDSGCPENAAIIVETANGMIVFHME